MAIILLVRHGQNDLVGKKLAGRLPDVHLNQHGQAQARQLAASLAALPVRAVLASPLERTRETAEPIARVHDLPVETFPELLEMDYGTWQGKSLKQLRRRKLWKEVQEQPDGFRFPEGESFLEAQTRVADGLRSLSEKYGENDLLVCVTHCDVIRLAVANFLGMPLRNFQRLQIDPASVSVLFLTKDKAHFGQINHTTDLPPFKK